MNVACEKERILERFELIVNGPALFNALVTGLELGLFSYLSSQKEASFDSLVQFTQLRADKLRPLLQALCATELLDKQHDKYKNSSVAEELLASEGEDSWRAILLGWQQIYYPAFMHMTTALRDGTNQKALSAYKGDEPTLYERLAHDPEQQALFHAAMSAFTLRSIDGLIAHPVFESVHYLLDIGGNDGTTATRLLARYPNMHITIFDLPTVIDSAQSRLTAVDQVSDRVCFHPGDLFADPFPQQADTILFSHLLEIFSEDQILLLLSKAYNALPSGGKVLIYGYNVSDDEKRGLYSARLSLYLNVLASGQGMAYPAKDWERWLTTVGFKQVETTPNLPYEHGLTIGWK